MQRVIVIIMMSLMLVNAGLNQLCELIDFYDKLGICLECLAYDDYGCWCGPGGSGDPVDESDYCCMQHDSCYDGIIARGHCNPYLNQYTFKNGTCYDDPKTCEFNICSCDRHLASCLSKNKYHWKYWGYRFWPSNCEGYLSPALKSGCSWGAFTNCENTA